MSSTESVFLDTSGLVALLVADDALHVKASRQFQTLGRSGRPLITTDWVLAELGNSLARTPARLLGAELIRSLLGTAQARVVFVDEALMSRALDRYTRYTDKTWGLVDCVSFEVMADNDSREAFTCDRHFEQAGFRRLPGVGTA
jgi:hypothetical protein